MSGLNQESQIDLHLATGTTRVARCWRVTRRDGIQYGFTDHDRDLNFDGIVFHADTGLSAAALMQTTGLSVDNTEAVGALSDAAITEADIAAGRFDDAEIEAWLVQWDAPENRVRQFRGSLGEITRSGGAFSAELRGLAEKLNVPMGRVYQKACSAILGDHQCRVDLTSAGYSVECEIFGTEHGRVFWVKGLADFDVRWFERGHLCILNGAAQGLKGAIKLDRFENSMRRIELWDGLRAEVEFGDRMRLSAGCDKRMETCRLKFGNLLNYRGFPDLPSEDWMVAHLRAFRRVRAVAEDELDRIRSPFVAGYALCASSKLQRRWV